MGKQIRMRIYYKILVASFLLASLPCTASSTGLWGNSGGLEATASPLNEISITAKGKNVSVRNAAGLTLEVYNITGVRIATYKIDSNDTTVSLDCGKGCYILKLGKIARKISIV